jgi:hypothetical protein
MSMFPNGTNTAVTSSNLNNIGRDMRHVSVNISMAEEPQPHRSRSRQGFGESHVVSGARKSALSPHAILSAEYRHTKQLMMRLIWQCPHFIMYVCIHVLIKSMLINLIFRHKTRGTFGTTLREAREWGQNWRLHNPYHGLNARDQLLPQYVTAYT